MYSSLHSYPMVQICTYVTRLIVAHFFLEIKRGLMYLIDLLRLFLNLFITKIWIKVVFFDDLTVYFFCLVFNNIFACTRSFMVVSFFYRVAVAP